MHLGHSMTILAFVQRAALLALLWWAIAEGRGGWLFAAPLILAAALASLALQDARPWRLRPLAAARVLPWFLARSLSAGVDVALRTLAPRPRIAPGFVSVRTRLEDPAARVLLADAMSLVPGTLSARLRGDELELHLLDRAVPVEPALRETEEHIAALLGLRLERTARA
jgi:multicomponent Na+:H+ antiporter subunit E